MLINLINYFSNQWYHKVEVIVVKSHIISQDLLIFIVAVVRTLSIGVVLTREHFLFFTFRMQRPNYVTTPKRCLHVMYLLVTLHRYIFRRRLVILWYKFAVAGLKMPNDCIGRLTKDFAGRNCQRVGLLRHSKSWQVMKLRCFEQVKGSIYTWKAGNSVKMFLSSLSMGSVLKERNSLSVK